MNTKTNNLPEIKKRIDETKNNAKEILEILKKYISKNIEIEDKIDVIKYALNTTIDSELHKKIFIYLKKEERILKNLTKKDVTSFLGETSCSLEILGLALDIADTIKKEEEEINKSEL